MLKRAKQKGFTLIELVVVIVILGILAAIVAPRFIDLTTQSYVAVENGACGALASASVLLYASNKAASTCSTIKAQTVLQNVTFTGTCGGPIAQATGHAPASTTCPALDPVVCAPVGSAC